MYTLRYRLSRREVWRWYWKAWRARRGLWRVHLCAFAFVGLVATDFRPASIHQVLVAIAWGFGAIAWLPLVPIIAFKAQERSMSVDEKGFSTIIGKQSGKRRWAVIRLIAEAHDDIVLVGTNGNAMIIPRRAFASEEERRSFLVSIRGWWAAVHVA